MGVGKSNIRIDLQQAENMAECFGGILQIISLDTSVDKYEPLEACKYKVLGNGGVWEDINIVTGYFMTFPLDYMAKRATKSEKEIALFYLNANPSSLNKKAVDKLWIVVEN